MVRKCQCCGYVKDYTETDARVMLISNSNPDSVFCTYCFDPKYDNAMFTLEQYKGTHIFIKDLNGTHIFSIDTGEIDGYDIDIDPQVLYEQIYEQYYNTLDDYGLIEEM